MFSQFEDLRQRMRRQSPDAREKIRIPGLAARQQVNSYFAAGTNLPPAKAFRSITGDWFEQRIFSLKLHVTRVQSYVTAVDSVLLS